MVLPFSCTANCIHSASASLLSCVHSKLGYCDYCMRVLFSYVIQSPIISVRHILYIQYILTYICTHVLYVHIPLRCSVGLQHSTQSFSPMPCHPLVHACFRSGNNMPAPRCHLAERCSSWWSSFLGGASWNSSECRAVSLYQYPHVFFCFSSLLIHPASSLLPLPSSSVDHHSHMLSYPFNGMP